MRTTLCTLAATLLCGSALVQQANVNLDFNPQKNTESLGPRTWRRSLNDFAPRLFK